MTGNGSLKEFLFSHNLVSIQDCVLCGAVSEDWFHVIYVCLANCAIRNLEDMDDIFNLSQCLLSSDTIRYANTYA